jgi:hypothetical protein
MTEIHGSRAEEPQRPEPGQKRSKRPERGSRCPPCEPPPACELECLVRPEFHCGQELTEEDLNALVRWADRRLARVRFRDGWGVVCGLDLCIDRDCPTRVHVSPGYAIDCCGNDLVLCDGACVDIGPCCPDPCPPAGTDGDETARAEAALADDLARQAGIVGLPYRLRRCVGVDICLEWDDRTVVSISRPGCTCGAEESGGCGCGCGCGHPPRGQSSGGPCAVTRRREGARLVLCKATERESPHSAFAAAWDEARPSGMDLEAMLEEYGRSPDAVRKTRDGLDFCSLGLFSRILEEVMEPGRTPDYIGRELILFWLTYDRRRRLGARACHDCGPCDRICIGRVWLFSGLDRHGGPVCFIGWIDTGDAVRRRLSPHRLPAPEGHLNLAGYLGRDPDAVALELAGLGLRVFGTAPLEIAQFDDELASRIGAAPPHWHWERAIELVFVRTRHGNRVVGWHRPPQKPAGLGSPGNPTAVPEGDEAAADAVEPLPVEDLPVVGKSRGQTLRAAGINSVADFVSAVDSRLLSIIATWSNPPRDKTPEALLEEMRRAAARLLAEGGGT